MPCSFQIFGPPVSSPSRTATWRAGSVSAPMLRKLVRVRSFDQAADTMRVVLARSPAYRRLNRAVYEAKQLRERLTRGQPRRESAKVAFMVGAAAGSGCGPRRLLLTVSLRR